MSDRCPLGYLLMKKTDCLFSEIQNLCNAASDWLIQKSMTQLKPVRKYPVPVVTFCVLTAEPVYPFRGKGEGIKSRTNARNSGPKSATKFYQQNIAIKHVSSLNLDQL